MMTGYIHTVYPRASVSMKMGSPLKIVGVLDTDVSTGVAGRVGPKPDMLPMSVRVKTGRYAEPHLPGPDGPRAEAAAVADHGRADQRHRHRGEPARGADGPARGHASSSRGTTRSRCATRSAARATPARWGPRPCSARWPRSSTSWSATRWPRCGSRRSTARSRSSRAGRSRRSSRSGSLSDTSSRARTSRRSSRSSRSRASASSSRSSLPIPADFPEGTHEAVFCDLTGSIRRRFRNEPPLAEPRDLAGVHEGDPDADRAQADRDLRSRRRRRTAAWPSRARHCRTCRAASGPSSPRKKEIPVQPIRSDLIAVATDALGGRGYRSRSGSRWSRTPGSRYR